MFTPFSFQLDLYRNYTKTKHKETHDELMSLPIGDSFKARHIYIHGSKREERWKLLDVINITSGPHQPVINRHNINSSITINPEGHLRIEDTTIGAGRKTYYFSGPLAQLESALVEYTVDRLKTTGFESVYLLDIPPEPVIRACGFQTQGIRSQVKQFLHCFLVFCCYKYLLKCLLV
ncbi:unnamed protein product [Schistosoma haematobium]|nr:unnamed protein product [Schistosoma haematobium]CAH8456972.1 unnamed protein product [Schistosoma haematobium]